MINKNKNEDIKLEHAGLYACICGLEYKSVKEAEECCGDYISEVLNDNTK